MLLLPIPTETRRLKLLVVLEHDEIDRMKRYDPAQVMWDDLGLYRNIPVESVTISYLKPEHAKDFYEWARTGQIKRCVDLIMSGFEFRPDLGDNDHGAVKITEKGN